MRSGTAQCKAVEHAIRRKQLKRLKFKFRSSGVRMIVDHMCFLDISEPMAERGLNTRPQRNFLAKVVTIQNITTP